MIVVEHVSKFYGSHAAAKDLNFEIQEGECVGFLGLNGAGKSTTLRMLSCLLLPTSGSIRIGKHDVESNPHEIRKEIGYLPDKPPLYDEMTCRQFLQFAGEIRAMKKAKLQKRIEEVLTICGLQEVSEQPILSLSHGYRQRVGIAQAIIHKPKLLILDEPFKGLDPVQIVQMRDMIKSLHGKHTILLSTHLLSEVEASCDRILFLQEGQIEATRSKDELGSTQEDEIKIETKDFGLEKMKEALSSIEEITHIKSANKADSSFVIATSQDKRAEIAKAIIHAGGALLSMTRKESDLEAAFLRASKTNTSRNKEGKARA